MVRRMSVAFIGLLWVASLGSCSSKSQKSRLNAQASAPKQPPSLESSTASSSHQASDSNVAVTGELYFLAGTPVDDYGYPVTLYQAEGGNLRTVREVLPQAEGVRSVRAWGNVIFLIHPAQIPKAVTVLHTDDPLRVDEVEINPNYPDGFFTTSEAVAEPKTSVFDELTLASKGQFSPENLEWLSITDGATGASPRIKLDSWGEYSAMRLEGAIGGPVRDVSFGGAVAGNNLVFPPAWGHPTVIDSLSPMVRDTITSGERPVATIVAASRQYLLLVVSRSFEELFSRKSLSSSQTNLFLHDRFHDVWRTLQVEGNNSRIRLFDRWLAITVEMFNPDRKPSPGQENERGPEAFGDDEIAGSKGNDGNARLPLVRGALRSENFSPGVLVLQNLGDGRKIRIETGQEDSEILSVHEGTVVYRVNDAVYQARIAADKLQDVVLLAKDEDVPEIHWVFWGPQTH
jgi:hypothetical protein